MKPTLTLAASLVVWGRVHDWIKSYDLPHRRLTWGLIGLAIALAVALIVSLTVFTGHSSTPAAGNCYAEGHFDGLNVYVVTPHTTLEPCDKAAKGAGLTNLSSLPSGLQQVCVGRYLSVFMEPTQVATVRDLGINPASICS